MLLNEQKLGAEYKKWRESELSSISYQIKSLCLFVCVCCRIKDPLFSTYSSFLLKAFFQTSEIYMMTLTNHWHKLNYLLTTKTTYIKLHYEHFALAHAYIIWLYSRYIQLYECSYKHFIPTYTKVCEREQETDFFQKDRLFFPLSKNL